MKIEIVETCLRCGYKWIRKVKNPKKCPSCRSKKWNIISAECEKFVPIWKPLLPGESNIYVFDKKTKEMLFREIKKNPCLKAQARADGLVKVWWPIF